MSCLRSPLLNRRKIRNKSHILVSSLIPVAENHKDYTLKLRKMSRVRLDRCHMVYYLPAVLFVQEFPDGFQCHLRGISDWIVVHPRRDTREGLGFIYSQLPIPIEPKLSYLQWSHNHWQPPTSNLLYSKTRVTFRSVRLGRGNRSARRHG